MRADNRLAALLAGVLLTGTVVACSSDGDDSRRPPAEGSSMGDTVDPSVPEAGGADLDDDGDQAGQTQERWVRVEEDRLVDSRGERVVLLGSTLYSFPFYLTDGWVDWPVMVESRRNVEHLDEILDRMVEVGFDTIRVPLGTDAWAQNIYALTTEEWLARVERIVAEAAERDMHVMFTWWDALTLGSEWPERYEESFEFMRAVHERVGGAPNVLIEPMNEPREITWEQWIEATSATVQFWRDELDYDGVLVLDTIDWSWSFDPDVADELLELDTELLGKPNLMFAIHRYANERTCFCDDEREQWDRNVGQYIDDYPIIITEVGNFNARLPPQPEWVEQFVDHLVTDGIDSGLNGVLVFTWRWEDQNTMTESDGVSLTPFGNQMVELLSGSGRS